MIIRGRKAPTKLMSTYSKVETLYTYNCSSCGLFYGVPESYIDERRKDGKIFYCPNGHSQQFAETVEQRLRKELANTKSSLAIRQQERDRAVADANHFKKSRDGYKGQLTKVKNEIAKGACPCCGKVFNNLREHIAHKHPEFKDEEI